MELDRKLIAKICNTLKCLLFGGEADLGPLGTCVLSDDLELCKVAKSDKERIVYLRTGFNIKHFAEAVHSMSDAEFAGIALQNVLRKD